MVAYTTSQSGNWSNTSTWGGSGIPGDGDTATVNHVVTVDTNAIVGDSPSPSATVLAINADLTVDDDVDFTIKGSVVQAGSNVDFIVGAGCTITYSVPSGEDYIHQVGNAHNQSNYIRVNGASDNKSLISHSGSGGTFYFAGGYLRSCLLDITYCRFDAIGDGSNNAFNVWPSTSTNDITIANCHFDNCGTVRWTSNQDPGANLDITDSLWENPASSTCLYLALLGSPTSNRNILRCDFGSLVEIYVPEDITINDCVFYAKLVSNVGPWTSFSGNLVRSSGDGSVQTVKGDVTNCFFLQDYTGVNPHYLQLGVDGDINVTGTIFETISTATDGDCVLVGSPGSARTYAIKNCIVLPNGAGGSAGTLFSALGNANVTISAEHNTTVGESVIAETYAGHSGMVTSFQSNIYWGTEDMLTDNEQIAANNSIITADYNCAYQATNDYEPASGVFLNPPGGNDVDEDPSFVDSTRDIASWDTSLGGSGTVDNALTELMARNSHTGIYDTNYTVSGLVTWIKEGFVPTNANLQNAGHDGRTIGAIEYALVTTPIGVNRPLSMSWYLRRSDSYSFPMDWEGEEEEEVAAGRSVLPYEPEVLSFEDGLLQDSSFVDISLRYKLRGLWFLTQKTGRQWYDISGYDKHGVLTNMPTAWEVGDTRNNESSLRFAGGATQNVIVPNFVLDVSEPFTISWKSNLDSYSPDTFPGTWNFATSTGFGFVVFQTENSNYRPLSFGGNNSTFFPEIQVIPNWTTEIIGLWQSYTVVFLGGDTTSVANYRFFRNGIEEGIQSGNTFDACPNETHFGIGQTVSNGTDFNGRISYIGVWGRDLDELEIKTIHENPKSLIELPPVYMPVGTAAAPPDTTPIGAYRSLSLSWLYRRSDPRSSPMDWEAVLQADKDVQVDYIQEIDTPKSDISNISWLQNTFKQETALIDWLQRLSKQDVISIDWMRQLAEQNILSVDFIQRLVEQGIISIDFMQELINQDIIPVDWSSAVAAIPIGKNDNLPVDWLGNLASNRSALSEWISQQLKQEGLPTEWISPVGETSQTISTVMRLWPYIVENVNISENYASYAENVDNTLQDGLIVAWMTTMGSPANKLYDFSKHGRHGAFFNMNRGNFVSGTSKLDGLALDFNGSDEYINAGDQIIKNLNQFSFSFWYKPTNATQSNFAGIFDTVFDDLRVTTNVDNPTSLSFRSDDRVQLTDLNFLTSLNACPVNQWTHVVGTYDGLTYIWYINGKKDTSQNSTVPYTPVTSTFPLQIGRYDIGASYFEGQLADILWYDRALKPGEIKKLCEDSEILFKPSPNYLPILTSTTTDINTFPRRSISIDFLQGIESSDKLPVSWFAVGASAIGVSSEMPLSWLQDFDFSDSIGVSYSSKTSNNIESPIEFISHIVNREELTSSWLADLVNDNNISIDWSGSAAAGIFEKLNIDWTQVLTGDNIENIDWRSLHSSNNGLSISYVGSFQDFKEIPIDFNKIIEAGAIVGVDWQSETLTVGKNDTLPIEWLLDADKIGVIHELPIDWKFTSSPLFGGIWVLNERGTLWVLNSSGNSIVIN